VVFAAVLYGASCVQLFYYYRHYNRRDTWITKAVVGGSWVCDTIHQMLISHTVYTYLVTHFDDPVQLTHLVWSLIVEVLFNGFTALLVQGFFVVRIWALSNQNKTLTISVAVFIIAEFLSVILYVSKALPMETFADLATIKALSMTVNALAAAGDVLIAAILCIMLHSSRTGFKRSDTMINTLIIFCVNTGLLTSLCAIASLVAIVVSPNTFIYICFYFLLGRLYCNSLLATLNARKAIRSLGENPSYSLQAIDDSNGTANFHLKFPANRDGIKVETIQEFVIDNKPEPTSSGTTNEAVKVCCEAV